MPIEVLNMRKLALTVLMCAIALAARAQTVQLAEGHELTSPDRQPFALTMDGSRLVYLARGTVFIRPVAGGDAVVVQGPLPGRNKSNLIVSPDGGSLLYWSGDNSQLERVPIGGGKPAVVASIDNPSGLSWGADGQVLIGAGSAGVLRVPATGGTAETVVKLAADESARAPQMLPGGDSVLFTLATGSPADWDRAQIVAQSAKTGKRTTIIAGHDARYVKSGHLIYMNNGSLMAVAFDAQRLATTSDAAVIASDVQSAASAGAPGAPGPRSSGVPIFAVAENGAVVYARARQATLQLGLVGLDGKRTMLGEVPAGTGAPRFSADGKKITYAAAGEVYVSDASNLLSAKKVISNATFPLLSPDGVWLAFGTLGTSRENGEETIWMQRADGSGEPQLIVKPGRAPESWVADAEGFTFITHRGGANNYDGWGYSVAKKEVEPLAVVDESGQLSTSLSPDRKWLAYMSSETGDWQVFVQPYPGLNGNGRKFQATKAGGRSPMWVSPTQIVFDRDGQMYSMTVQLTGTTPVFGEPQAIPVTGYIQPLLRRNWDLKHDGQNSQFLMLFRDGPQLQVVTDWAGKVPSRAVRN